MLDILDSQKTSEFQEFPNFKGSEYEEFKCIDIFLIFWINIF